MFDLKIKEIKRILETDSVLLESEVADSQGIVREIKITYIPHGKYYSIHGICHVFEMVYDVYLVFDERTLMVSQHHCSCHEESVCEHIGAVMLRLLDIETETFPYHFVSTQKVKTTQDDDDNLTLLMDKFDSVEETNRVIDPEVRILVELLTAGTYRFSMGSSRLYIIQNYQEFFERMANNETVKYGKELTLRHQMSQFDDQSRLLLQSNVFTTQEERTLGVDPSKMDTFYELMKESDNLHRSFEVLEMDEPFEVEVTEKEDLVYLEFPKILDDHTVGESAIYFVNDGALVRFETNHGALISDVIKNIEIISKEKYQSLVAFLLERVPDVFDFSLDPLIDDIEDISIYCDMNEQGSAFISLFANHLVQGTVAGFDHQPYPTLKYVEGLLKANSAFINDSLQAVIEDQKELELFIRNVLPQCERIATVYASKAFMDIQKAAHMQFNMHMVRNQSVLKLDFDSLDFPRKELKDVYDSFKKGQVFHRLKDGTMVKLDRSALSELEEFMDVMQMSVGQLQDPNFELHASRLYTYNAYAPNSESISVDQGMELEKYESELTGVTADILRDYQKEGVDWFKTLIHYGLGGILADDMGLGKTLQTLSVIDQHVASEPAFIVTPATVMYNWINEIERFTPHLKVVTIHGDATTRKALLSDIADADIILTSYDYVKRDHELYEDIQFSLMFIDEAQTIKNPRAQVSKAVKSIKATYRFALSGTPLENRLSELWSLFDFIMPGYLYSYQKFMHDFEMPIVKTQDVRAQALLHGMVSPFILRRLKTEVLEHLPTKKTVTQIIEMSQDELKIYQAHLLAIENALGSDKNRMEVLAQITRLRQICLDPRLVVDMDPNTVSSKLKGMMEIIRNHPNEKILVFSSFTKALDLMGTLLDKEGVSFHRFDGSTSKERRSELVDEFQQDDIPVFLISLKAGGTGINLTAASVVIHMDPWWNISVQNQATDRVYRMGQTNDVVEYALVMKNSIEEQIIELQKEKQKLANRFIEGHDGSITSMNWEDIIALFKGEV